MTRQQLLVLIFTFIVGAFSGAYMYVTAFAPEYSDDGYRGDTAEDSLVVLGEQFGGCQMGSRACASFRLMEDRRYEFLPAHSLSGDVPETQTGKVTQLAMDDLTKLLAVTDFTSLNEAGGVCKAAADGIDYKYTILYRGETYELTSCGTTFGSSRLYNDLLKLWGQMLKDEATGTAAEEESTGPLRWFVDRFGNS